MVTSPVPADTTMNHVIRRLAQFVTEHNRTVILLVLLVTAGVVAGVTQLDAQQDGAIDDIDTQSDVAVAADYLEHQYGHTGGDDDIAITSVYIQTEDGRALDEDTLIAALEYQQAVHDDPAVTDALAGDMAGPPNLIATALVGEADASLDDQIAAIDAASEDELDAVTSDMFADADIAQTFLPTSYEPGTTDAESMRMVFEFMADGTNEQGAPVPPSGAEDALAEAAADRDDPAFFTLGEAAQQSYFDQQLVDTVWLILPTALLLVLGVLAFAYRDLVDVLIGFAGVIVSVAWMFGLLGWFGIPAGMTMIIGPVLIVALSIDFGLHVFMRYREQRGPDDPIRPAMRRSTASVTIAFLLVTLTAGIGFLSNLANPLSVIAELGIGITLGVISAFIIFSTLVPALKVSVDGLLERIGIDRRQQPLGKGRFLQPVLRAGVRGAKVAAPVIIILAVMIGAAGGVMVTSVDTQGFQNDYEVAEWQEELPGPLAWESHETEFWQNQEYVQTHYQAEAQGERTTQFLIEGDPTDPATLDRVAEGTEAAAETEFVFTQGGEAPVQSPLSVMHAVAAEDEAFAETLAAADTTGDDIPDENVDAVYDALFTADADRAGGVIERTDGDYRSLVMTVPVEQVPDPGDRGTAMHDLADAIEADSELTVTPVGSATIQNAEMTALADGILETMVIALAAVLVTLAAAFRMQYNSLLLGVLTVIPIGLVVGMVFGGMYLFDVPLTLLTALLVSITIGLGIDYNIHISDRFIQEYERGATTLTALDRAVTGTGGALLGSALTSGAAVTTLVLHPHPQFESFGLIVALALGLSFLVSVFVLPSLLYFGTERLAVASTTDESSVPAVGD